MTTIILFAILVLAAVQTYAIYTFKNIKSSTKTPCKRKKNEDAAVTCKTDSVDISLIEDTPVTIAEEQKEEKKEKEDKKEKEEKEKIVRALEKNKGDLANAAKSINLPYIVFYNKVNKYGLSDKVVKSRGSHQKLHKLERIDRYCKLRRQGVNMVEAAQQVGVCTNTSIKYELIFKNEY
jgi:stalled ribosome rescue protein Dom34